ncbi:nitroreductase family protein [Bradyrhizobium sp. CCBAU 53340]|uniref:nitroreductase family protein n=1 Tax=Bradyrhizobium sp. CCBAU 53340 TaxID=1325112 RepID=UPI001FF01321|nr:nitroreductase family protein [Bradyrhizobium sp. CCBAU 53340]
MEFETLVQSRRSARGFKNEPVPRAVIEAVIERAKRACASSASPTSAGKSACIGRCER